MKSIILLIMFVVSASNAQDYSLDSFKKTYEQKQQALVAQYGKALDAELLDLKKKGDLDNYLLLEAEKKRLDAEKTAPALAEAKEPYRSATVAYSQSLANLQEQYIKALDEFIKKNLIANRIEDARTAKAAKDEVVALLAGLREVLPAPPSIPTAVADPLPEKPALSGNIFSTYSKDLVLYYSFDKNMGASVPDASKNKNDGRLLGAQWVKGGKVGGACVFNGRSERILVDHDASLELGSGPRTIGAWIKSYGSTGYYQSIFCKGSAPGYSLRLGRFPDRALEYYKSGGTDNSSVITSSQTIDDSDWHHVVVVDQGNGTVEFFMDGLFLEAMTKHNYNTDTKEKAAVGGLANTIHTQWFNGIIDELFIFKRALTKTEVKRLYDAQNKK